MVDTWTLVDNASNPRQVVATDEEILNVDLIALDRGEVSSKDICDTLMITLNEYANSGFQLMKNEMDRKSGVFFENTGLLQMIRNFCM